MTLSADNLRELEELAAERNVRDEKVRQSRYGRYDDNAVRRDGLMAFVRYFWSTLEPSRPMIDGWPLWAMCEHLEAVTSGEINRLLINVPPGFMKSMLTDVFWPAWEWGPMGFKHYRYLAFSYSAHLTERDNDKFRTLISSPSYQHMYGPVEVSREEGEEVGWASTGTGIALRNKTTLQVKNTSTGWKLASSVGGVGTGERGDRVIVDDPHNVIEAESQLVRTETVRWFRESISSRFNDLDAGALVVIMQRVHFDDVSGVILDMEGVNYVHLNVPWFFDPSLGYDEEGLPRRNGIGWSDPRCNPENVEGTADLPAWPDRFSDAAIDRLKREVNSYAWSAQFQQRPVPRGEAIFRREWWQIFDPVGGMFPVFDRVIVSIDGAFTEKTYNNPSACTVWGIWRETAKTVMNGEAWQDISRPRIMLVHAWRKWLQFTGERIEQQVNETWEQYVRRSRPGWGLLEWILYTCKFFKADTLLIEKAGPGIAAAQALQNRYGNQPWGVHLVQVKGDKVSRALAAQATFSQQLVYAPDRDWAETVITEMEQFPLGKYDDLTDATTMAINFLRAEGHALTDEEVTHVEAERVRHRPKPKALYPV